MDKEASIEIVTELARLEATLDRNAKAGRTTLLEYQKLNECVALAMGRLSQMKIWEK